PTSRRSIRRDTPPLAATTQSLFWSTKAIMLPSGDQAAAATPVDLIGVTVPSFKSATESPSSLDPSQSSRVESGDHPRGKSPHPATLCRALPSAFITTVPPSSLRKAISLPSGDGSGDESSTVLWVSCVSALPSRLTAYSS